MLDINDVLFVQDAANKREALMNRRVMSKLDKLEQATVSRSVARTYHNHTHK